MTTFIDTNLHNMLIDTNFHFTCHLFVDHEDKHEKHVSNKKCRFKQCPIFSGKKNYGQVASTTCQASICGFVGMVIGEFTEGIHCSVSCLLCRAPMTYSNDPL